MRVENYGRFFFCFFFLIYWGWGGDVCTKIGSQPCLEYDSLLLIHYEAYIFLSAVFLRQYYKCLIRKDICLLGYLNYVLVLD